jgi:replicative DNA helicase
MTTTDPSTRTPPFSEDAEIAVLAALMQDDTGMAEVRSVLPASAFCVRRHRMLYQIMLGLHDRQSRIDPITVSHRVGVDYFDQGDDPEVAGARSYVGFLMDAVPTAANVVHHARIVARFAAQRDLIAKITAAADLAWSGKQDPMKLAQQLVDQLLSVAAPSGHEGYVNAKDVLLQIANDIDERRKQKGLIGIATGFPEIDERTGGWRGGELVAICGVPKAGKSVVLQNFAKHNILDGVDVGFVAAEMTRAEMLERMMSDIAGIPTTR